MENSEMPQEQLVSTAPRYEQVQQEETYQITRLTVSQNRKKQKKNDRREEGRTNATERVGSIQIDETVRQAARGYRHTQGLLLDINSEGVLQESAQK